jgi:hypothetical protein
MLVATFIYEVSINATPESVLNYDILYLIRVYYVTVIYRPAINTALLFCVKLVAFL